MVLQQRHGTRIIFYVMFVYILASFSWWSVLFFRNNRKEFVEDAMVYKQEWIQSGGAASAFEHSPAYDDLKSELRKRNLMILGEGLVFLTLISVGFWRINSSFQKEIDLTRLQNNFILSITHELKSPLASIKLAMETLLRRTLERDKVERLAGMSIEEVDRLERLVENILLASRIENPDHRFQLAEFSISDKLREISSSWDRKYASHPVKIINEEELVMRGDSLALASVINNLVENGAKYAPEGSPLEVTLASDKGHIVFRVTDCGEGIADIEKPRVFQRFYRVGNENTRKSKGTGLGLFIVHEIVRAHGGTISISDNKPSGAIFTVRFPYGADAKELSSADKLADKAGKLSGVDSST